MSDSPSWLSDLRRALGGRVVDDPDIVARYAVDWTGRFRGRPACVVRPASVEEVVALMRLSAEAGFGLVPQGGNTGLVGATQAPAGTVILNLEALRGITDDDGAVVAAAGTTIAEVARHARERGHEFGLDMASRDSATVGGAFATNAGGLYACRFGRMADQVTGVEAVLADGTVVSTLEGPHRSVAGVDPARLLAGSEGGLAVVTALRLRLHPPIGPTVTCLSGFADFDALVDTLAQSPPVLAAEVFGHPEMEIVTSHAGLPAPLARSRWYLLVELEERHAADFRPPPNAVVGDGLWEYRDRITESFGTTGVVHKHDIVVPRRRLPDLVERLGEAVEPNRLFVFGHVLMDDFHVNIAPPDPAEVVPEAIDDVVFSAVEELGGVVAGEHGIGRLKRERYLARLDPVSRRLAEALKRAVDPDGRLNPGVGVWPAPSGEQAVDLL
ncbi:MAG: FAD-binding oxidoreductase [Actinomycetes bacterium]|nr:FAD-binding oxidoreductase [Acidimicrobiia bacterium]